MRQIVLSSIQKSWKGSDLWSIRSLSQTKYIQSIYDPLQQNQLYVQENNFRFIDVVNSAIISYKPMYHLSHLLKVLPIFSQKLICFLLICDIQNCSGDLTADFVVVDPYLDKFFDG